MCCYGWGERVAVFRPHLCDPDEDLQLVDVELLVHALGEPGPQQVHGGSVPLLKHINATPSSKTHTRAQAQQQRRGQQRVVCQARTLQTARMLRSFWTVFALTHLLRWCQTATFTLLYAAT